MHSINLLHRDIKPENIVFDDEFNAKLCDFGWTAELTNKYGRKSVCGTFEYMSPEVIAKDNHDFKNDIWGLGVLFYELLHGIPPFRAKTFSDIQSKINS